MKIWDKDLGSNAELNPDIEQLKKIEQFTVGNDYLLDKKLLKYDCKASIAHVNMLQSIGLLNPDESKKLVEGLNEIMELCSAGNFSISQSDEDCHAAIENYLTRKYGEAGKKVHTTRSRNDQVLVALRLYEKEELSLISVLIEKYMQAIESVISRYGCVAMPGYTHMQKAMPTTVAIWLGSYKDSMNDNLLLLDTIKILIDQNPLGSAAGFGVPVFDIDRNMTAKELGFSKVMDNPMYCQFSRGKFEAQILNVLSTIMLDLNKLSTDLMLFSMKEFGLVELPQKFCTGSSIMPQKKNPDVLELMRAKYHVILGEEFKIKSLTGNLISGYNRDLQLTKEPLMNSVDITKSCLEIMSMILSELKIDADKCEEAMTKELYATQEAYELVKKGMPFRDAYKEIGKKYFL